MSAFNNPFNPDVRLGAACTCGMHRSQAEHDATVDVPASSDPESSSGATDTPRGPQST
jgi:hypothetical protein